MKWDKNSKPSEDICPEIFCFFWSELDHKCRDTFGKCRRLTLKAFDYDWYEPCEPELEKHDLPWFFFIANENGLVNERKNEYIKDSKKLWNT
ncbi:MAG: hypothetical protein FWG43_04630 [Clostridiales bacterium]|jgi:hypothetical protein|nr:hypothetical protein [Clostridiales bacterium]